MIKEPTVQQAYERIRKHFSKPGAVYGYDASQAKCQYRTELPSGKVAKCAVGCLIPKSSYNPVWDARVLTADQLLPLIGWTNEVLDSFLAKAQDVHDQCALDEVGMGRFIVLLDKVARAYSLKVVR